MSTNLVVQTLIPVLVQQIPFIFRKGSKLFIADVKPLPQNDVPIRVCNGVAYGSFAFHVYNRRFAHFYGKYSIPFLDYFRTDPKWAVSNPRYGEIDAKNRLRLCLDNIPRNQTVTVIVDTECKVDPQQYLIIRITPQGEVLSESEREKTVELINSRDFSILGFKMRISARCTQAAIFEIRLIRRTPDPPVMIPAEFVNILTSGSSSEKIIEWEVDLNPGEIKRYRITMT